VDHSAHLTMRGDHAAHLPMRGDHAAHLLVRILAVLAVVLAGAAAAQETVRFTPHVPANLPAFAAVRTAPPAQTPATLLLPSGSGRVAAVVIVHGSGGVDGRGARYAQALQQAGIASLEIDMWAARGIRRGEGVSDRPRAIDALPDVAGAVRFLAMHPRVDPGRIGMMGMSYGATQVLLMMNGVLGPAYTAGGADMRAGAALYPPCWGWIGEGPYARLAGQNFPRLPLLLLAGDADEYDADQGAACRQLVAAGSPAARARTTIHVYPSATHAWDTLGPVTYRDPGAFRGRGGQVRLVPDTAATRDAMARLVAFFQASLTPR
jgi:dienelactone hydrolase